MNWMQDFLDSTKELESPQSYFYWSMLTTISSVVGRKLWVNRGDVYNLYPNVYTFLISKKSGLRKGIPVNVAKKLAHDVGLVRVIDGQNTVQGVIKELSNVKTVGNGHVISTAEGFLITGEFASFLLTDGTNLSLTTLTDLYDAQYHDNGFKKTLASEEIQLKAPCLTALFASNETHFFDAVPKNAISGGFLARTFCIYEEKRNTINSLTNKLKKKIDYEQILNYLKVISKLEGEMVVSPEALEIFDEWYKSFSNTEHDDDTGTSERLGDNIWKAATLIGLANNLDQFITKVDMDEAIHNCMITFSNLKRLLIGGVADAKSLKAITMRTTVALILETDPLFEIERKKILRRGAGQFGVYDLDECIEYLSQAGMIKVEKRGQGIYYKLTEIVLRKHLQMRRNGTKGNGQAIGE